MTRDEFEAFMEGEQWTPEQIARFSRMTPVGSAASVRSEMARVDGIIEVNRIKIVKRPFFTRLYRSYANFRGMGFSVREAARGAWVLARA